MARICGWQAPRKRRPFCIPNRAPHSTISGTHWGLRGHGQQRVFSRQSVHSARTRHLSRRSARPPERQPTFTVSPVPSSIRSGSGGVALGIARGTMDAFLGLPREKTRRGAGKPMVENNVVQSHVAQSEARWRSARYFLHAAADEAFRNNRGTRRDGPGSTYPPAASPPPGPIQSSREIVQYAVSRLRLDGGVRGKSVRTPFARHRHGRAARPGGAYCTTRRSVRSCLACRPRISSSFGQAIP